MREEFTLSDSIISCRNDAGFRVWSEIAEEPAIEVEREGSAPAAPQLLLTEEISELKKQIYELARKSYLAVKDDGDGGPFDMIHTENFMLIDTENYCCSQLINFLTIV